MWCTSVDETGGRRFLPLHCGRIDLAGVKRDRDQLWAEAVGLYRDGAQWWLDPDELQAARVEQEERFAEDAWADDVAAYGHAYHCALVVKTPQN